MDISYRDWHDLVTAIGRIDRKINLLLADAAKVEAKMADIDVALSELTSQVAANTSAEQSAVTLIQQLADLIAASAGNPQAVRDLATQLKASADALGAAVVAGTP